MALRQCTGFVPVRQPDRRSAQGYVHRDFRRIAYLRRTAAQEFSNPAAAIEQATPISP